MSRNYSMFFAHLKAVFVITLVILVAQKISAFIALEYKPVFETAFELGSIILCLLTASVAFNSSRYEEVSDIFLGTGYLSAAVFGAFHVGSEIFKQWQGVQPFFSVAEVMAVAGAMYASTFKSWRVKSKRLSVYAASLLILSISLSFIVIYNHHLVSTLIYRIGVNTFKVSGMDVIVFLLISALYRYHRHELFYKSTQLSLFVALVLLIVSSLYSFLIGSILPGMTLFGAVLKVIGYAFVTHHVFCQSFVNSYRMMGVRFLAESELLDQLPVGILLFDSRDRFVYGNRRVREFFGDKYPEVIKEYRHMICLKYIVTPPVLQALRHGREEGAKEDIITVCTPEGLEVNLQVKCFKLGNEGRLYIFTRVQSGETTSEGEKEAGLLIQSMNGVPTHGRAGKHRFAQAKTSEMKNGRHQMHWQIQKENLAVLEEMAAGIIHEIRNPLTAIQGFGQILEQKAPDDLTREYAALIVEEAQMVNRVVTEFMAFARPLPLRLKKTSINNLLTGIKPALQKQADANRIQLVYRLTDEEREVLIDQQQIKQVIERMVENAIEALNNQCSPLVEISTRFCLERNAMVLTVRDNGTGITPDIQDKICTPFFTTKDLRTGLGLSICYQIIREHNGCIEIDSKPGQGTRFDIYLPCADRSGRARVVNY